MVKVPPLPTFTPAAPAAAVEVKLGTILGGLSQAQVAQVEMWVRAHPPVKSDVVALALGAVSALQEHELLQFMDQLRATMSPDLWELLTGD